MRARVESGHLRDMEKCLRIFLYATSTNSVEHVEVIGVMARAIQIARVYCNRRDQKHKPLTKYEELA